MTIAFAWRSASADDLPPRPFYPTGLRPLTPEEEAWRAKNVRLITKPEGMGKLALPSSHLNIRHLPIVGTQMLGTCSAWAMSYYYKTYQEAREHGWVRPDPATHPERVMGTAFTYNLNNNGEDKGSNPFGIARTIVDSGNATWKLAAEGTLRPDTMPPVPMFREAAWYRGQSTAEIDLRSTAGRLALKQHLAGGDPAVIGMELHTNFQSYPDYAAGISSGVLFANVGPLFAHHAFCIVGYDDNKEYFDGETVKSGAFLLVNSWGPNWGVEIPEAGSKGFLWVAYEKIGTDPTWGSAAVMEDRIGYEPTTFAVYGFQHVRSAEMLVSIHGGDRDYPDWSCYTLIARGLAEFNGLLLLDITDYMSTPTCSFWMRAFDARIGSLGLPPAVGTITYFAVERPGQPPIECTDVPVTLEDMKPFYFNVALLQPDPTVTLEGAGGGFAASAWGDYDNDGDLDLAFGGYSADYGDGGRIYRNAGDGHFVNSRIPLPACRYGAMAWGDYDNDGDLDLAYSEETPGRTKILRNKGNGAFEDSGVVFPFGLSIAWGDYDNDGYLDLAVSFDGTRIYRNDRRGGFVDPGFVLPPHHEYAFWADFDQDGWLDLVLFGSYASGDAVVLRSVGATSFTLAQTFEVNRFGCLSPGDYDNDGDLDLAVRDGFGDRIRIWANDGRGVFSDSGIAMEGFSPWTIGRGGNSLVWGDFNNDGLLDLGTFGVFENDPTLKRRSTRIYLNTGAGYFRNAGFNMPGMANGTMTGADADNDGDLDLLIAGIGEGINLYDSPMHVHFLRNYMADLSGDAKPNTAPQPPSNLTAIARPETADWVSLLWSPGSDAETSATGLYYNVRIGTRPGAGDVVSGLYATPFLGNRLRPTFAPGQLGMPLQGLQGGKYCWSVQSIDTGLRRSAWSAEQTFVSLAPIFGDVNRDHVVDVADAVLCERMATGATPPDLAAADLNKDGRVTAADVAELRTLLAGLAQGNTIHEWKEIGPAGGTLVAPNFQMTIPAGAFTEPHPMKLWETSDDLPFSTQSVSNLYQVEGVPMGFTAPLRVKIKPTAPLSHETYVAVGEPGYSRSVGEERTGYRLVPVTAQPDGFLAFELPAMPASPVRASEDEFEKAAGPTSYTFTIKIISLSGYSHYTGTGAHFIIYFPWDVYVTNWADLENLATYLEDGYDKLKASTVGLSYVRRTAWPVEVTVRDLGPEKFGICESSYWGENCAFLEINSEKIADANEMKATTIHEFFHLIQGLYDTRWAYTKKKWGSKHLWMDEATAVWSEELLLGPTHNSAARLGNELAPIYGVEKGIDFGGAQAHGYGMSTVIKYLVGRKDATIVGKIYDEIYSKSPLAIEPLLNNSPDPTGASWWNDFFTDYIQGRIFPFDALRILAAVGQTFRIRAATDVARSFSDSLPDMSAKIFKVLPDYPAMPDNASMMFRLKGTKNTGLLIFKFKPNTPAEYIALGSTVQEGIYSAHVGNLKQIQNEGWWLAAIVTNNRHVSPYADYTPFTLDVSMTQNSYTMIERVMPVEFGIINNQKVYFPYLRHTGSLEGPGLGSISDQKLFMFRRLTAKLAAAPPATYTIRYNCVPESTSSEVYSGMGVRQVWTIVSQTPSGAPGIRTYEIEYDFDAVSGTYKTIVQSPTGVFNIDLTPDRKIIGGSLYAIFDVRIDTYSLADGQIISTETEEVPWPVMSFYLEQ